MIPLHRVPRHFAAASVSSPGADSASAGPKAAGTSPGAPAGGSSAAAAAPAKITEPAGSPRADGKAQGLSPASRPAASSVRTSDQGATGSDGKSLAGRAVHHPAATPTPSTAASPVIAGARQAPATAPVPLPAETVDSEDEYDEAATELTAFFERERSTLPSETVDSIDHFLSYGEWGIAHSLIARIVQKRGAASEGVSPGLLAASALVLNQDD